MTRRVPAHTPTHTYTNAHAVRKTGCDSIKQEISYWPELLRRRKKGQREQAMMENGRINESRMSDEDERRRQEMEESETTLGRRQGEAWRGR